MKEILKVLVPLILGAFAGIFSMLITQDLRERDAFGITILVIFIYIQKFIFSRLKIKLEPKDWLSISFLSLSSWYVTWTFLLNL
ncbi:MAG: hypothetical protein QXR27_01085 [Archaeoglobaceae archaeon]